MQARHSPVPVEEPNLYELTGKATQITYSTTSFAGRPQLDFQDDDRKLAFSGDEIRTGESELGLLVSVTLEVVPDLHTLTLTLVLPAINLKGKERKFRTLAVMTSNRTSIGGTALVTGALQTYEILKLRGVARQVDF